MQITCIIGTDTEIGKTYSCCQIMKYLIRKNQLVAALKPIASGASNCEYGLLNEDVYQLFKASNYFLNFEQINPLHFNQAIAPHIAAKLQSQKLNVDVIIKQTTTTINSIPSNCNVLIEGAGGLMLPLNDTETYLNLLIKWNYPIILVVGMKLGCLNHALLTEAILRHNNLPIAGWVANQINPQMEYYNENLDYLTNKLSSPLLATIAYQGSLHPTKSFKEIFKCH